ncbi:50S ribosomal protein L14 [Candidatus Vidania fulgoroideorum]
MIKQGSILDVSDNSGAKKVLCIRILFNKKKYSNIGDLIKVAIKKCSSKGKVKKGQVCNALIINTIYGIKRKNGNYLKFYKNSVVILNNNFDLISTRVFGIVPREIKNTYFYKILSMCKNVV